MTDLAKSDAGQQLLAFDIYDLLARGGYGIGADHAGILQALPGFLEAVAANAATSQSSSWETDAGHWSPGTGIGAGSGRVPLTGYPPAMNYLTWRHDQGVDVGAAAVTDWYWRCPVCQDLGGPYPDVRTAKGCGLDHRHYQHGDPTRRAEARLAARRACDTMTADVFDETVARLIADYMMTADEVLWAIQQVAARVIYSSYAEAMLHTAEDVCIVGPVEHISVPDLLRDIAATLGHDGWWDTTPSPAGRP